MKKISFVIGLFLFYCLSSFASDIVTFTVLTDHILVVHFLDGRVEYHGYHQTGNDDKTIKDELDLKTASDRTSYWLTSTDDPSYKLAVNPLKIGRKSKPAAMSMKCIPNEKGQCMSDYVMEHYVYLFLAEPLKPGKTYQLKTGNLAKNQEVSILKYNLSDTRSLAVHVNQLGFVPQASKKLAYISHWMGDAGPLDLDNFGDANFHLIRTKDYKKVFTGSISKQKDFETGGPDGPPEQSPNGNFVAADVWQCDFSSFSVPGEYIVSVERMGTSYPFSINEDIYREPFIQTARSLYHHRSGIALTEPFTRYERDAPHNPNITPGFRLRYTKFRSMDSRMESQTVKDLESLFDDSVDASKMWGWYQDAGDWDSYVSHAVIPAFLMTTFELKPRNFTDGELNIPESRNGIPDILDEAGWLLYHYRRAKGPTGGNAGGRIEGDNYPKKEAGYGLPSYDDIRPQWIVYGEDPRLTFLYAKLAAQMAYCFKIAEGNNQLGSKINSNDSITIWKTEALKAFIWARNNLRDGDEQKIRSQRADAEAWLYKLTGEKSWLDGFKSDLNVTAENISRFGSFKWGIWAYVTMPEQTDSFDKVLKSELVKATESYARSEVTDAIDKNRSFRMGGPMRARTEVGQATTPAVMPAIIAWETTRNVKYLEAVHTTCDYMLGGNQLDMTWITGVGDQYPTQVFNMDWWYNKKGIKEVVPGIVPYGPTADCDWMPGKDGDCNAYGWWDSDYAHSKLYPDKSKWPVHERWYNNRYAPPSSEYTVHQNIGPSAAIYGYLTGKLKKDKQEEK